MREVLKGTSSALVIRVLGTILGFAVSVFIARSLGAEGSGVYFLALSVVTIAATVARLGFDNTLVRLIASHSIQKEWGEIIYIHKVVLKIVALSSFVVSVLLFFSADFLANALFRKDYMMLPLQWVALAVMPLSLLMIQAESLRGLKAIPSSQWLKTVFISLFTLMLVSLFIQQWGSVGAVAAYVVSVFISAGLAFLFWSKVWNKKTSGQAVYGSLVPLRTLFQSSWPLFAVALTGLVMQQSATMFLGAWGTTGDVGIFNIANRVAALLLFPLMAMISILSPKFSEMYRENKIEKIESLAKKSSAILFVAALLIAFVVSFNAEFILSLFGSEFNQGVLVLNILLIGVVVNAGTGAVAELLMMTGHEKDCRNMNLLGALGLIALSAFLIPNNGGLGAAVALTIAMSGKNILMVMMVRMRLGFLPVGWSS